MALKNTKLAKVGSASTSTSGQASGHTQMQIVVPATALADPGARNLADPSWPAKYQAYLESITPTPKYSQDWE
jgi:hypothetical protein